MIYVNRDRIDKPAYFFSKEYEEAEAELHRFFDVPLEKRRQKRFTSYRTPLVVREALHQLFNDKCVYCESKVELKKEVRGKINPLTKGGFERISTENLSTADHFRPRTDAKGFDKESIESDHYWWLMYEWHNFYLSCRQCNASKSSWFPVEGKRATSLMDYNKILNLESPLLLDPCHDRIDEHLVYALNSGSLVGISERGLATIEILNLNRRNLVNGRLEALKEERENWNVILNRSKKSKSQRGITINTWKTIIDGSSESEYLGIRRAFIKARFKSNDEMRRVFDSVTDLKNYDTFLSDMTTENLIHASDLGLKEDPNIQDGDEVIDIDLDVSDKENERIDLTINQSKKESKSKKIDKELLKIRALLKNVHIEKIELKNYKCFEDLEIIIPKIPVKMDNDEDAHREHWLVFLGENGVGKSSLIKAVAIALMGQDYLDRLELNPKRVLKRGKRKGHIKVYGTKKDEIYEVTFNSKSLTSNINEPACYLLGYGSTRLLPKGGLKPETGSTYAKSKNLFDYSVSLSDAKEWLLNLPDDEFDNVANSLKDLLLLGNDVDIKKDKNEESLFIDDIHSNNKTDIEELSDGYKSIFALTVDIIKTLSLGNITFKNAEAVVLLDEIGTHLHPRWKMEVVERLRETFPKIQFIVTTHEPLCLRGLEKNEVVVLKKDEDQKIISVTDLPSPSDFRVDQLLTSEYFGLNSTIDIDTEKKFKEYYELLAKDHRTSDDDNRISELSSELPNKIGSDIRDELAYYAIDELLAKQVKNNGFKLLDEGIKQEAVDRVKKIWDDIDSYDKN